MVSPQVRKTLWLVWPLLFGIGMIMVGNGLQGTLLGLRANMEGFPLFATGIIMSLYYFGFLIGCTFTPRMISGVGHIRVFAALASLASTMILLKGLYINPWLWATTRVVSGISFAGLFIVAESWLNNIATKDYRGQIFGAYLFILHTGLLAGQFMINLAPVGDMDLFILISVLISLSMIPVTLANKPSPGYEEPDTLPFRKLFGISPLSIAGVTVSGFCAGTFLTLGPVFADQKGMDVGAVSLFMGIYVLGSSLVPLAAGWFSDRVDRRKVIIAIAFLAALAALAAHITEGWRLTLFLLGGLTTSTYSISIAYMNDRIRPEQMVSASTSLILMNGVGACLGPLAAGVVLQAIGPAGFFPLIAAVLLAVAGIGIHRAIYGKPVDVENQSDFIPVPARVPPTVMQMAEEEETSPAEPGQHKDSAA